MDEPIFRPHSKDAGMRKTAMSLADVEKRVEWVKANYEPRAKRVSMLNHELETWWKAYATWNATLTDSIFIDRILTPLQQTYGTRPWPLPKPPDPRLDAICSIDELEKATNRFRR